MTTSTLDRCRELIREEERLRREQDRTAGALEQVKARLTSEFNCSLEKAEKLLSRMRREEEEARKGLEEETVKLEEEYQERLQ